VAAVTVMEGLLIFFGSRHGLIPYPQDNPLFNSGKGAVFNVDGKVSSIPVFILKQYLNKIID
jgi:hypothetical protein